MPVNPQLVDVAFDPVPAYLVGREKIREFAAATHVTDPQHTDVKVARGRGYADIVAPPTFPIVIQEKTLAQLLAHPESGIDFSRVVHGDQKFEYSRPIVAGDELVATLSVTKVQPSSRPLTRRGLGQEASQNLVPHSMRRRACATRRSREELLARWPV